MPSTSCDSRSLHSSTERSRHRRPFVQTPVPISSQLMPWALLSRVQQILGARTPLSASIEISQEFDSRSGTVFPVDQIPLSQSCHGCLTIVGLVSLSPYHCFTLIYFLLNSASTSSRVSVATPEFVIRRWFSSYLSTIGCLQSVEHYRRHDTAEHHLVVLHETVELLVVQKSPALKHIRLCTRVVDQSVQSVDMVEQ